MLRLLIVTSLSKWNVSKVTDMSGMFWRAPAFNRDISKWDVSRVTDMIRMFSGTKTLDGDLSWWDVSGVAAMNVFTSNIVQTGTLIAGASAFNGNLPSGMFQVWLT